MPSLPDDSTDLDFFMSLPALDYTDKDLDIIIAYQRNARANREAGIKPTRKPKAPTNGPKASDLLKSLGLVKPQPKTVVGTPGGLRRL